MNRPASILSVYLLLFAIIGGLIAFIIPPIVAQTTDFVTNLPRVADHLRAAVREQRSDVDSGRGAQRRA